MSVFSKVKTNRAGGPEQVAPASTGVYRSRMGVNIALCGCILMACLLNLVIGSGAFRLNQLASAFVRMQGDAWLYIRHYRIPRTELAVLVGMALGVAGCLVQAVTRNPLAGPGILGVNSGAALSVVIGIHLGFLTPVGQTGFAILGAGLVACLVFIGGVRAGNGDPVRLLLFGTATGACLESITAGVTLLQPNSLEQFRQWAVGSVADRSDAMVPALIVCVALGIGFSLMIARSLDVVAMGDDLATGLGVNRIRLLLTCGVIITLLSGAATAVAGPIVFVGLLVPHLARFLVGIELRWLIPTSALLGALLLLCADVVGRVLIPGSEIPAGAVSAVIGAPLFFIMIHRMKIRL